MVSHPLRGSPVEPPSHQCGGGGSLACLLAEVVRVDAIFLSERISQGGDVVSKLKDALFAVSQRPTYLFLSL